MIVVLFEAGVTPFAAALAMLASSASVLLNTCRLLQGRVVCDKSMQAKPAAS